MPCFLGSVVGIVSLLVLYYLYTRCDEFADGNVGAD